MSEKKVILIFVVIIIAIFTSQVFGITEGTISLFVIPQDAIAGPDSLNISVNADNTSVDLNWSAVSGADSYTIYYSSNISQIMLLNVNSFSGDVTNIENITDTNWTDTTADQVQKRYYTVSAVKGSSETLTSDQPAGKFTYYYSAPVSGTYGTLATNWISLYLYKNYTAENFLQELPVSLNPTISKLNKSEGSGEYLITHVRGVSDGNDFNMYAGDGYALTVDNDYNHTIAGKIAFTPYVLDYGVPSTSSFGRLATNWKGIFDFNKTYTAESFSQEIPANLNPSVSILEKADQFGEYYLTHIRGINDGNNFQMELGKGYAITTDDDYAHTLCTGCFS